MRKQICFAGGCFWGVEKYFALIDGVQTTVTGYANGHTENPSYEDVCRKGTGHAETVKVVYDSEKLPLNFLLTMFYQIIDPTSLNKQGNDVGPQYRTGIYYTDEADKTVVEASLKELQKEYDKPLAVELLPLKDFWPAEEYHQKYLDKNPGGYCHIPALHYDAAKKAKPSVYRRKPVEELRRELTGLQFDVTQNNATEPPFQNEYCRTFHKGIYVDITTGEPLFSSTEKFESGCGWPSFAKPIEPGLLIELADTSHNMLRTEVRSKTGDAHLGHVFPDGPAELGGLRYCINSASLRFIPLAEMEQEGYGRYVELVE